MSVTATPSSTIRLNRAPSCPPTRDGNTPQNLAGSLFEAFISPWIANPVKDKYAKFKELAFQRCGLPPAIRYSPDALSRLTPDQEKKFVGAYVELVNKEGNRLANQPNQKCRLTQISFAALNIAIKDAFQGDLKNLRSFKNSTNPFAVLAEKFNIIVNPTLRDFADGHVRSIADLKTSGHRYAYSKVLKFFNPFVVVTGSFSVKVPSTATDGISASVTVYEVKDPSYTHRGSSANKVPSLNPNNIDRTDNDKYKIALLVAARAIDNIPKN
jgi:hypothetical protein